MKIEIISEMGMRFVRIPFLSETEETMSEYESNILKNANISGLAEVSTRVVDGCIYLIFPIYSYISLEEKLNRELLNQTTFFDFFGQLRKVYENLQMYLLDGNLITLEPEYIFYNQQEKRYIFLPVISEKNSFSQKYEKLFTFLADKCPIEEKELLGFIFENFSVLSEEQFEPMSFLKYITEYQFEKEEVNYADTRIEEKDDEIEIIEKSKTRGTIFVVGVLLFLAIGFSLLADREFKYGIVSVAASLLAVGIMGIQVFKITKSSKKSAEV